MVDALVPNHQGSRRLGDDGTRVGYSVCEWGVAWCKLVRGIVMCRVVLL